MTYETIQVTTQGEGFYPITNEVKRALQSLLKKQNPSSTSGILHLFVMHTSCALVISEDYDPSAMKDLENFFKHLAPGNLPFIQ
ncbi:MAG: YjbQ family protein, partial [Waddliaceae bacterium]